MSDLKLVISDPEAVMTVKRKYIKPEISLIIIDNSITLMMISNPNPRRGGRKGDKKDKDKAKDPFASPFGDNPF